MVASGPDAGKRYSVSGVSGACFEVGRDPGCSVPLTDPLVSRRQLEVRVAADGAMTVEALGSHGQAGHNGNRVRIDGKPIVGRRSLLAGQVVTMGSSSLVLVRRERPGLAEPDSVGQLRFNRTPEFSEPVEPKVIDALSEVPSAPDKPRFAYLSAILPLLLGVGFGLAFGPRYLLFALLSPVMLAGNHFEHRRRFGRRFKASVTSFEEDLAAKVLEVAAAEAEERRRRFVAAPDLADLVNRATDRRGDLWNRSRSSREFLNLRIGLGDIPASFIIKPVTQGDAEYLARVDDELGHFSTMAEVPVTLGLAQLGVIGLLGPTADTTDAAASLALQACCLHSPEELIILACLLYTSPSPRDRG